MSPMSDRDFLLIELHRMRRYIADAKTAEDIDEQFLVDWLDELALLNERVSEQAQAQ